MLSHYEKQRYMQEVPFVKLSYENISHKKVETFDYISIIPRGGKCFLWFHNAATFLVKLEKKQKVDIFKIPLSFPRDYIGTLLYGTLFHHEGKKIILIENIWIGGTSGQAHTWGEKLVQLQQLLPYIHCSHGYVVGVPVMCKTLEEATHMRVPYKIYAFHYYQYSRTNWYEKRTPTAAETSHSFSQSGDRAVFHVVPDHQCDIYHLFCMDDNNHTLKEHSIAHICNYQHSVFMNSIFRNIKENRNLDALEESDDETEFENINEDKYLLDVSHAMICEYHAKFKKWKPIQIAPEDTAIVTVQQILHR